MVGIGSSTGKTFSQDVLQLEVCGSKEEHFSVIDVPGIFMRETEGVTTEEDRGMVYNMVEAYVSNSRSVILAVTPACQDPATQTILTMAKKHEPEGTRTLGVLTKPDQVEDGAEESIMKLVRGEAHKLKLGWYMVKNLSQKELSAGQDRDEFERNWFRSTAPWNKLDSAKVGIDALTKKLKDVLTKLTKDEFPKV